MEKERLLEILYSWNPWWKLGKNRDQEWSVPGFQRDLFHTLVPHTKDRKIEIIIGPRQTGKSTLLKQIISKLIEKGTPPSSLFYLQLDELSDSLEQGDITLREIIELFSEQVARVPLNEKQKIVFLDEVHLFDGWAKALKTLVDQGLPIKFYVSGSASSSIMKNASKLLAGRMRVNNLLPLTFSEMIRMDLKGEELEKIKSLQKKLQEITVGFLKNGNKTSWSKGWEELRLESAPLAPSLRAYLSRYLQMGGYPEPVVKKMGDIETYALLKSFLTLMIQKDFVEFFNVRDTRTLERLIKVMAQHTGQILVERNLTRDFGISINTLRNHIGFLLDTGLISTAKAFTSSFARASRLPEKFFFLDPGLRNSLSGYIPESIGQLVESAIFIHLKHFLEIHLPGIELNYWRQKGKEVDIVASIEGRLLPIEVHKGYDKEIGGMVSFMGEFSVPYGLLVSEKPSTHPSIVSCSPSLFLLIL
ncbi:MAG: ATP-binding protein [Elusimicrobia bacterium]|nr:ATP-binding protein [Elusimicrobiota bacterium]